MNRANVRMDNKQFGDAIIDYNECIKMMSIDGEDDKGLGKYPEYPDAFVGTIHMYTTNYYYYNLLLLPYFIAYDIFSSIKLNMIMFYFIFNNR